MEKRIKKVKKIEGEIEVPGDKSISHRSLILGSISEGKTRIYNFLKSKDCLSTLNCLKKLGANIEFKGEIVEINGDKLKEPDDILDCENSGTTMRLLSGVVASYPFYTVLTGDESLRNRPMRRIIEPLSLMGAKVYGRKGMYPPLTVIGNKLKGINYKLPVASAQVKSCIILATILSDGESIIEEEIISRDHTERMLEYFGGEIKREGGKIYIKGKQKLKGREVFVPGDFSSAAYFMAATLLIENSSLIIKNLGLNPTRTGFLNVIERMGGKYKILNMRELNNEPVGDIEIIYSGRLKGVEIKKDEVPKIIDEIPLIAVISSVSEGKTVVSGAEELRVKETDRIKAIVSELKKLGANIEEKNDGFVIYGVEKLKGGRVNSWNDHRIAMCLSIAGLISEGETIIENADCVDISFPEFF